MTDDIKAAIQAMQDIEPLPVRGPGPDLILSRSVYDSVMNQCDELANAMGVISGIGIQTSDLLPSGTILGVTELGRQMVKDMISSQN